MFSPLLCSSSGLGRSCKEDCRSVRAKIEFLACASGAEGPESFAALGDFADILAAQATASWVYKASQANRGRLNRTANKSYTFIGCAEIDVIACRRGRYSRNF
ncbi:hypothetical protein MRX96_029418 [Rhipicephalus microplus]